MTPEELTSGLTALGLMPFNYTTTYDPANVPTGSQTVPTFTVLGAALGDFVDVSFSLDVQGLNLKGYVSAANTVTVIFRNNTLADINLASGTIRIRVTKI